MSVVAWVVFTLPGGDGPSMSELGNRLWLLRLLAYMVKRLSAQGECLGS